jgi:hypothetical protein
MKCLLGLLLFSAVISPTLADINQVHHNLNIKLDPARGEFAATDTITFTGTGDITLALGAAFTPDRLVLDKKETPLAWVESDTSAGWRSTKLSLGNQADIHTITLHYTARLHPFAKTADPRSPFGPAGAVAGEEGSYLPASSGWYLQLNTAKFTYRLSLDMPKGQKGLVPGRLLKEQQRRDHYQAVFEFTHPAEGIELLAGPYNIKERQIIQKNNKVLRLRTYFHPEIAELAPDYLASISTYIELYNNWIGDYPFTEFSIVSSPFPTGLGMPTLTYLGIDVLRLPFIRFSSLGHEVLHNWWGNGVYVDWRRGNWSEGLTTFMADYTYTEQQGPDAARAMRASWLRDFAAIPAGQDQALENFSTRSHSASQSVGYHKAAFLFFMLRDTLGTETFDAGLRQFWRTRQFSTSSWIDLQNAFEFGSGQKLDWFFEQWLTRKSAPGLTLRDVEVSRRSDNAYQVSFKLAQTAPAYRLRVPVVLTTASGKQQHLVELSAIQTSYVLKSEKRPLSLALDPDFQLFRRLQPGEVPPILRQAITDPATVTVIASHDNALIQTAKLLANALLDSTAHFSDRFSVEPATPLLIIGTHAHVEAFLKEHTLPGRPATLTAQGTAQVWTRFQTNGKVLVVISVKDSLALEALLRPLPHYGQQSFLVFDHDKVIERGIWPTQGNEQKLSYP